MGKGSKRSLFRRINNWLHLWLSLVTGIIMFVVCITACIWVFNEEITEILVPPPLQPDIPLSSDPVTLPSRAIRIADSVCATGVIKKVTYARGKPIAVSLTHTPEKYYWNSRNLTTVMVNPYTGVYMGTIDKPTAAVERRYAQIDGFFQWIIIGHRDLWLPYKIGSPIVSYSTLVFVITLITGLVWWYPRKWNKSTREKSFKIKWKANWKRINLDFHNVLGFYSLVILLILSLTGMVYGIAWFEQLLYRATNWGAPMEEYPEQLSDSADAGHAIPFGRIVDESFVTVTSRNLKVGNFLIQLPDMARKTSSLSIQALPNTGTYYRHVYYAFDRYTGKELPRSEIYGEPFEKSTTGQQIRRMNYDIHVGSIWGLPGKILAFFASLIGASLPITGFIIWYNRKWGKKKKEKKTRNTRPIGCRDIDCM